MPGNETDTKYIFLMSQTSCCFSSLFWIWDLILEHSNIRIAREYWLLHENKNKSWPKLLEFILQSSGDFFGSICIMTIQLSRWKRKDIMKTSCAQLSFSPSSYWNASNEVSLKVLIYTQPKVGFFNIGNGALTRDTKKACLAVLVTTWLLVATCVGPIGNVCIHFSP